MELRKIFKKIISKIKNEKHKGLCISLGNILYKKTKHLDFLKEVDLILPVPIHTSKLKKRGFNQVEKIFKPWMDKHHFHYCDILERTKQTKSQYQLLRHERQENLANAFTLKDYVDVKNRKCLLIDDIFTTGSTLKNCAMVLKNHGAKTVSGLVLASQANINLPTKPSKEVFF